MQKFPDLRYTCFIVYMCVVVCNLVPRPLQDFILQLCKIKSWSGLETRLRVCDQFLLP